MKIDFGLFVTKFVRESRENGSADWYEMLSGFIQIFIKAA